MKVILSSDIPKLGHLGEVKNVANGYARNFLIPFGFAEPATESALTNIVRRETEIAHRVERERAHYEKIALALAVEPLRFQLKMGEKGQPFGSISANDIADALKQHGFSGEKRWIELAEGIKTTGEHSVKIRFPHQVEGEVKLIVEPEEASKRDK